MSLRPDKLTHSPTLVKAIVARILRRSYSLILIIPKFPSLLFHRLKQALPNIPLIPNLVKVSIS